MLSRKFRNAIFLDWHCHNFIFDKYHVWHFSCISFTEYEKSQRNSQWPMGRYVLNLAFFSVSSLFAVYIIMRHCTVVLQRILLQCPLSPYQSVNKNVHSSHTKVSKQSHKIGTTASMQLKSSHTTLAKWASKPRSYTNSKLQPSNGVTDTAVESYKRSN